VTDHDEMDVDTSSLGSLSASSSYIEADAARSIQLLRSLVDLTKQTHGMQEGIHLLLLAIMSFSFSRYNFDVGIMVFMWVLTMV
jgi:hypothetical protein